MTRLKTPTLIAIALILAVILSIAEAAYRRHGGRQPGGVNRFRSGRSTPAAYGLHFERDSRGRLRDVWYDGRPDGLVYDHRPGRRTRVGWNPWISPFNPWVL